MHATDKAWEDEAKALRDINQLDHPNITRCIAAIRRGGRRYFVFAWAEGGNLQEYWENVERQSPNAKSIQQMVEQLRGLADALDALHNCRNNDNGLLGIPGTGNKDKDRSIRHGDLKPENVLRFLSGPGAKASLAAQDLGTLKIADMGLAKQHCGNTAPYEHKSKVRYYSLRGPGSNNRNKRPVPFV